MEFKTYQEGEVTVIEGPMRLDASIADDFRALMNDLVAKGNNKIVVDLKETGFVDSSGLGALVSRIAQTRSKNGDVRLAHVSDNIKKLFQITHLDQIFKCFDSLDLAIKSFD